MRTAFRTCVSTRCLTELSMVAENKSVWRSAGIAAHDPFDGRQETHVEHAVGLVQNQHANMAELDESRLRKSHSLPGVAMITCAPLRMDCNCVRSLRPPMTTAARIEVPAAILAKVSWLWMASSRVGLKMMARTPPCDGSFPSRWMRGRTNASVLPVPVCAVATTSRPARAGSIAWAWTAVGS